MSQGADEHFAQLSCNGKDPAVFEDLSYYQGFKDLRTFFFKTFLVSFAPHTLSAVQLRADTIRCLHQLNRSEKAFQTPDERSVP
jgi:hypothetical protein